MCTVYYYFPVLIKSVEVSSSLFHPRAGAAGFVCGQ